MFKFVKNFILKIQNSDEATRKFWLFVFSGISMAVVVALWLVYVNLTVARVAPPAGPASGSELAAVPEKAELGQPGFFEIFGAGVKIIFDKIAGKVNVPRTFIIENQAKNFIAEDVEPIAPTKLP